MRDAINFIGILLATIFAIPVVGLMFIKWLVFLGHTFGVPAL